MTSYLYSPPSYRMVQQMEGALRYGVPTSTCVYRKSGLWTNVLSPSIGEIEGCDVGPSGLLLMFTRPTVVPTSLFAEMSANAITPSDPSWTPGSLTLIP